VRAFVILCCNLGLTPSVYVFLYFFEVKDLGKKLWVNFNGVARRVLLTLFQQSYKGFKKNFFKVHRNRREPFLLDGFPLYWTENPNLQRARSLEDLSPQERGVCELLFGLSAPLNTLELLKREFSPEDLKTYIGTPLFLCLLLYPILSCILVLFTYTNMGFNNDKKKKLVDLLAKRRAAGTGTSLSTPLTPSTLVAAAFQPTNPTPCR